MGKQEKSILSFAFQHKLDVSRIHPLADEDFNSYRIHEILALRDFSNLNILDVGCGTGRVTNRLIKNEPKSIQCIDPSISEDDFDAYVKNVNRDSNCLISFSQVSALDFSSNKKFDLIFIIGVLHHIPDSVGTLLNLKQFLTPKGKIVVWVYSKEIGFSNRLLLTILRGIFPYLGPLKVPVTKVVRKIMQFVAIFLDRSSEIRALAHKDKEESTLALFDQLNAGYAKYYAFIDITQEANSAGLIAEKVLPTGRKGWTVLFSQHVN